MRPTQSSVIVDGQKHLSSSFCGFLSQFTMDGGLWSPKAFQNVIVRCACVMYTWATIYNDDSDVGSIL